MTEILEVGLSFPLTHKAALTGTGFLAGTHLIWFRLNSSGSEELTISQNIHRGSPSFSSSSSGNLLEGGHNLLAQPQI